MDHIHKRIRNKGNTITRQDAIRKAVEIYRMNNPQEYQLVIDEINRRRALSDGKFAIVRDDINAGLNSSMRLAFCFPPKLWDALRTIIDRAGNTPFLESKEEYRWFVKEFPQFFIPKKY